MIGDAVSGKHPVVAVNDTRNDKIVEVSITDNESKRIIWSDKISIKANHKLNLAGIPKVEGTHLWIIEYKVDGKIDKNHYVAYSAPIDF